MNRIQISVILLVLMSSLGIGQISQAAPTEKRYEVQHGMLEQEMTATGISKFETQHWMDFGGKILTIREQDPII